MSDTKSQFLLLEDYFKRIGYTGPKTPVLETLKDIHRLHAQTIPFENLNPFLRIPVALDSQSLIKKLVKEGRGGYCFEHNLLLKEVLTEIGFEVKGLAARILWNLPPGVVTARGHMLLLVKVDGEPYIADVGFGGLTLTAPLKLQPEVEQSTPHEPFRLMKDNEEYTLQAKIKDEWKSLYYFNLQEQLLQDYEVSNWYLSNNPTSHFVTGLIAARPSENGRYTLRNNEFAFHKKNGSTEKKVISDSTELKNTLQDIFGITLPQTERLDEAFNEILSKSNHTS